ncbi:sensor histidine kinase [Sphingobium lignivorans]|uniref:histidine kinase n=1 Tax=Sphingobium lignivorans TaxID=2735886 RepID=A0ABR6NHT6_9SPHN|nr:HAMP domain-containing sensor histidine kinase [Sphingobium lignivorans]MBB5986078.1 signal transduction histidine kinase [Sphingobium lignivorans]
MIALKPAAQARLDHEGSILSADAALLRLQVEAGGDPNGPLAVPALAQLVRLVRRLSIPVSRAVEVVDGASDASMWVQIRPDGEGYALTIVDWQTRAPEEPAGDLSPAPGEEGANGWSWQVDARLRFRRSQEAEVIGHEPPRSGEPLTGYFLLDIVAEDENPAMPLLEALALRVPFRDQPARLRADPSIHYRLFGEPLFDNVGGLTGYRGQAVPAVIHTDLSAASASPSSAEAGRIFSADLGRRLDQALRQPIGRIIANASTISGQLQGPLRQDYANYAADIAAAGRHLLELIDDLADLQAIERPGFTTAKEEVDLADMARRAAGLLNLKSAARHVRIQTPPLGERAPACAEYRRVLQILVNLVGNAVRHSPGDSTVWVRVDVENGRARVVVADQGGGIDPADHERIFERFERLGLSGEEGSGLGLYISRRLARAMGGDVTVESALGQGARFTLDLPSWTGQ